MTSDNKPERPLCKKCPSLAEKGLLGMVYGMCLTCIRNTYNIPDKAPWSRGTAGNPLGETSSANNHVEQSGAVEQSEAAEESGSVEQPGNVEQSGFVEQYGAAKQSGAVDGAVDPAVGTNQTMSTKENSGEDQENTGNKGAGATVSSIGNGETKPAAAPKKRGRPAGVKNSDGVKLTPACARCKRAKIRCKHRQPLGESNNTPVDVDVEGPEELPPPRKKKTVRIDLGQGDAEEKADAVSGPPPSPPWERKTRGIRKRKVAETEDAAVETNTPAHKASQQQQEEEEVEQQPPQKRSRRGRKPKNAGPVEVEDPSDTAQAPRDEPLPAASGAGIPAPPSFPADGLEGAALLSQHVVLSRELQQKLVECETKWLAAVESLKRAKELLDSWVSVWRSGL